MTRRKNFSSILTFSALVLVGVLLPITTKLVQQRQEIRSKALVEGGGGTTGGSVVAHSSLPSCNCVASGSLMSTLTCKAGVTCKEGVNAGTCKKTEIPTAPSAYYNGLCGGSTGTTNPPAGGGSTGETQNCQQKYGSDYHCIPTAGHGTGCQGSASDCLGSSESCCKYSACSSLSGYSCNATADCQNSSIIIATGCTGDKFNCCKSNGNSPSTSIFKKGTCNTGTGNWNCTSVTSGTVDNKTYFSNKTTCETYTGCSKASTKPGVGKACGTSGECVDFGKALTTGTGCTIPSGGIPGTVKTGLCSGTANVTCCQANSSCTSVNTTNGCVDTSHVTKCVKDSSSGVMGWISVTCDSGQTCSGTGSSATCGTTTSTPTPTPTLASTSTSCTDANGTHPSGQNFCNGNILEGCTDGQINQVVDCTTSGQICSNGTCVTQSETQSKISFKFTLAGVAPNNQCIGSLGNLRLVAGNLARGVSKTYTNVPFVVLSGQTAVANIVDASGVTNKVILQAFEVQNYNLGTDLADLSDTNFIKVKGPISAQMRFCQNGQGARVADTTQCSISFAGSPVYDFTKYAILAGDVNQDGMINGIDYSYVKTRLDPQAAVDCGVDGDLNMDGVVNSLDVQLIKISLGVKDDE